MKRFIQFFLLVTILFSATAKVHAADVSFSLAGVWQASPYKEHDAVFLPVPFVFYEGKHFYIRGLSAGVKLWQSDNQTVSAGLSYAPFSFDSSKTDNRQLKKLDDRHATVDADLQYSLRTDYGHANLKVAHDILGNSDAFSADVSYKYPFTFGNLYISPGAGMRWDSKEQMDYYFGVSSKEARKSGLDTYTPDGGISPYLSLDADWRFTGNWSLIASGNIMFLSEEIKKSPMVDKDTIFTTMVGIKYTL